MATKGATPQLLLEVTASDLDGPIDECSGGCVDVVLTSDEVPESGASVSASVDDVLVFEGSTNGDGTAQICFEPGVLDITHESLEIRAETPAGWAGTSFTLDVRPFGWGVGRVRVGGAPDTPEHTPDLRPSMGYLFAPAPDTWYAFQVTSAHRMGGLLWFAGTAAHDDTLEKNAYLLGVATREEEVFVGGGTPILEPATWDAHSQNAPTVIATAEGYTMWFHGRSSDDVLPVVGRAFSVDGITWTADPDNPVYSPSSGGRAAHPTVVDDGDGRIEMWTLGEEGIEYALSSDGGASFTPFCDNPVLRLCKTPEVTWNGERYLATYACGEDLDYRIHWAESFDGLRWVNADGPILTANGESWQSQSVANGQVHWNEGVIEMTYVGVGETGAEPRNGIGVATIR